MHRQRQIKPLLSWCGNRSSRRCRFRQCRQLELERDRIIESNRLLVCRSVRARLARAALLLRGRFAPICPGAVPARQPRSIRLAARFTSHYGALAKPSTLRLTNTGSLAPASPCSDSNERLTIAARRGLPRFFVTYGHDDPCKIRGGTSGLMYVCQFGAGERGNK